MAFQLDDLLKDDKKDANLIPDLSKATCETQEQFRQLHERCPEFKIKPEKVKREDTKVRDKDFSWKTTKKELRALDRSWNYGDPLPPTMKSLNLRELQQVAIDWKMLTSIRPKIRQDEEMFSRLVEMGKLEVKTLAKERRSSLSPIRRSKNRAGIIESSVKMCPECGEEYCFGETCGDTLYDSFLRVTVTMDQPKVKMSANTEAILAGMNRSKNKKQKSKGTCVSHKKSTGWFVRKKPRKNGRKKSLKTEEDEDIVKSAKPFKRKCMKYGKKVVLR